MKKNTNFMSYFFIAVCTAGLMISNLSFNHPDEISYNNVSNKSFLSDTTVTIKFKPLSLADPAMGKFEPGQQAEVAIDSFENLWNNAPSGVIQFNITRISKSDLFSISALDSLLKISNSKVTAKYLTILKGIDPASGNLKSYLALVDSDLKIIRQTVNTTYIQDGGRCPEICPE